MSLATYPPTVSTYGGILAQQNQLNTIAYVGNGNTFYLSGPFAPVPGCQDGLVLKKFMGLMSPFDMLELRGARQDGATWTDSVYDVGDIMLSLEVSGTAPQNTRDVIRYWIDSWDPKTPGQLIVYSPDLGEWWTYVRMGKSIPDMFERDYTYSGRQIFTWTAKNYDAFWRSAADSVSQVTGGGGYLSLTNIGDQPGWPRYLCYGPGTFNISNGPNTPNVVSFGPLNAGQIVLITTLPRLRSIVDLSPNQPAQVLTSQQVGLQQLISFAVNGNIPPLLQQFESFFGIVPPQGNLYSLLNGRFTVPLAPATYGVPPATQYIGVSISGGNSNSKVIGAVTPLKRWPL